MASKAVKIPFTEAAAPATPAAGEVVTYAKTDGLMYSKNDAGVETLMSSGSAGTGTVTTVEEVDGTPTNSGVTKIVFPNGTLGIVGTVATYTPAAASDPTQVSAKATANASMAANNTWQDVTGATISLAAGNWLVWGWAHFLCVNGTAANIGVRITDGTNHHASNGATGGTGASMARTGSIALGPVAITLGSTTSIKLMAVVDTGTTNTVIEKALTVNGVGDNATGIAAIKVA